MAYSLPSHHKIPSPDDQQYFLNQYGQYMPPAYFQGSTYPIRPMDFLRHNQSDRRSYEFSVAPNCPHHSVTGQLVDGRFLGQVPLYEAVYSTACVTSCAHKSRPSTIRLRSPEPQSMPVSRVLPPSILSKSNNDKRTALAEYDVSKTIVDGSKTSTEKHSTLTLLGTALQTTALNSPEAPRALNRKTKQSDYALWVGNLPRRANVVDLKDHFSQDATNEIQSIYLIYASKCAFVNYRSATALAAALAKFQGSVYRGMRLVCRVRKEFTTLRSDHRAVASPSQQRDETMDAFDDDKSSMPKAMTSLCKNGVQSMDRYFIIKSLAVKYLEISKESGIWAAQRHNEFHLNQAFKTAEHVYLIFSANKSGEYFGYARMMSPINDEEEPAVKISRWPKPSTGDLDDLAVMTTVATSTAPKGRIIDNSTRGTTFWEADPLEKNEEVDSEKSVTDEEEAEAQVLSRPFRIQWLSNERVPFHNTRNLHNPWNANRKVKVARDGTEIEPSIGRKLVQLFHPM